MFSAPPAPAHPPECGSVSGGWRASFEILWRQSQRPIAFPNRETLLPVWESVGLSRTHLGLWFQSHCPWGLARVSPNITHTQMVPFALGPQGTASPDPDFPQSPLTLFLYPSLSLSWNFTDSCLGTLASVCSLCTLSPPPQELPRHLPKRPLRLHVHSSAVLGPLCAWSRHVLAGELLLLHSLTLWVRNWEDGELQFCFLQQVGRKHSWKMEGLMEITGSGLAGPG